MGIEVNKDKIERFLSQEVFFGGEEHLAVVDEVFDPDVVWRRAGNGEVQFSGTDAIKEELRICRNEGGGDRHPRANCRGGIGGHPL